MSPGGSGTPFFLASSATVAGRIVPSTWQCSSTLGSARSAARDGILACSVTAVIVAGRRPGARPPARGGGGRAAGAGPRRGDRRERAPGHGGALPLATRLRAAFRLIQ